MSAAAVRSIGEDPDLFSELTGMIYDAAVEPDRWVEVLERLSEVLELKAASFALTYRTEDGYVGSLPITTGMDQATLAAYGERFVHVNPFRAPTLEMPVGSVASSDELVPVDEFEQTEFYRDFYMPAGFGHGFTAVIDNDAGNVSTFVGLRSPDQARATEDELNLVRLLTPHLRRAQILAGRLGTLSSQERIVSGVLDRLPVGIVFLEASGEVLRANERGNEILGQDDGLSISRGRLVTGRVADTHELDAIIQAACAAAGRPGPATPMSLKLTRPSGRRDLEVMACPIDVDSRQWGDDPAAAFLVLSDGETELDGVAHRLRELYMLSDAESKLAVAIASGTTVKEWAAQRGVSVETVRWQLKQVFAKTATSRQSDLMRLVLLGPALIGRVR